jgi:diguanylate cyclase (GGDEF)-like protein/PAS domain S-box-containing protein
VHLAPLAGGGIGVFQDITERKRVEKLAREQEQRLSTALSDAGIVLFSLDGEGRFTLSEGEGLAMLGLRPGELVGQSVFDVYADSPDVPALARRALAGEQVTARVKLHERVLEVRASPMLDEEGHQTGVVGVATDVTDDEFARRRLKRLAYRDPLTGLPNRLLFERQIEKAIARARDCDERVALLFIDLDDFKLVNDSLGHAVGDRLLSHIADRLRALTQRGQALGRQGGDEFLLLLPDLAGDAADEAVATADRVATALEEPFRIAEAEFQIEASIGISLFPDDADTAEALLAHADAAMSQAKRSARGSARRFAGYARQPLARLSLAARLRRAAADGELVVHYQPVFSAHDGHLASAEALVRWQHPERGLLGPAEFLPLAEEMGTMHAIGASVLEQVCSVRAAWLADDLDVPIAINVSLRQLRDGRFVERVASRFARHGLAPSTVAIEVTETTAMTDVPRVRDTLRAVSELGMSICLDDFGAGFSSLGRLREVPADVIKVDRSLLRGVPEDPKATAILGSVAQLAQSLGTRLVIEGVERPEQLELIREQGYAMAQGFLLGRPMPADDIEELLRSNAAAALAVESVAAGVVRGPWPQMADTSASLLRARG